MRTAAGEVSLDLQEFISQYVVRFEELKPAPGAPPDAKLPRFNRERFMVLGRNSERPAGEAGRCTCPPPSRNWSKRG